MPRSLDIAGQFVRPVCETLLSTEGWLSFVLGHFSELHTLETNADFFFFFFFVEHKVNVRVSSADRRSLHQRPRYARVETDGSVGGQCIQFGDSETQRGVASHST